MALLNPGSSDVRSTTYEGALVELLTKYRVSRGSDPTSTITINIQNNAETIFISANLPIELTVSDDGAVTTTVVDESASDFVWVADATSDIKAASLPAQIFALASKIQSGTPTTTDNIDRVTLSLNTDTKLATLNANFALTLASGAGLPVAFEVSPYIADLI